MYSSHQQPQDILAFWCALLLNGPFPLTNNLQPHCLVTVEKNEKKNPRIWANSCNFHRQLLLRSQWLANPIKPATLLQQLRAGPTHRFSPLLSSELILVFALSIEAFDQKCRKRGSTDYGFWSPDHTKGQPAGSKTSLLDGKTPEEEIFVACDSRSEKSYLYVYLPLLYLILWAFLYRDTWFTNVKWRPWPTQQIVC